MQVIRSRMDLTPSQMNFYPVAVIGIQPLPHLHYVHVCSLQVLIWSFSVSKAFSS